MKPLRLAGVIRESIVAGPGIRLVIFTRGCPHHCEGCHNPETHDPAGGYISQPENILNAIRQNPLLQGVTFSGGEPFAQAPALAELGRRIRNLGLGIMTYTGYTYEYLMQHLNEPGWEELLAVTDILVDGPFILAKRSLDLRFRGSSNQRIIDIPASRQKHQVVEWSEASHDYLRKL